MSWRLAVRHRTTYRYAGTVVSTYNEARVTPVSSPRQTVLSSSIEVHPAAHLYRYVDGWGTVVHSFDLVQPHNELVVVGHSVTETAAAQSPSGGVSWEDLAADAVADRYGDLLAPTHLVALDDPMRDVVEQLRSSADPTIAAIGVFGAVRDRLKYKPGSTAVSTTATDAFAAGVGVCQDFVHVSLALLRGLGIPARYVSGYVHNRPDAPLSETVRGESHAWVDVWTGSWWGYDPTGGTSVGERHVVIASGREYSDVAPLKGVYAGAALDQLDVEVELTRRA